MSANPLRLPTDTSFRVRTPAEIAAAGESIRMSITNSMRQGDGLRMADDASTNKNEISRELAPDPHGGARFRTSHLRVSILLAAINRDLRRGDPSRIEAWRQLLFGGVNEVHVEQIAVVRFTKDGRQYQLLGDPTAAGGGGL